jgi:hypothetical protein
MIRTPTTFIIGAGASKAYGLPVGVELLEKAQSLTNRSTVYQWIVKAKIVPNMTALDAVLDDLRQHPAPSIDAFLESRQDDDQTMRVGRALIAALLAESILAARDSDAAWCAHEPKADWICTLVDKMRAGAPSCKQFVEENRKALRFVTFNFDRLVEARLGVALRSIYRGRIDEAEVAEAVSRFEIIHVHGELPQFPSGPISYGDWGFSEPWLFWLLDAMTHIRVILDDIDPETLARAREGIDRAQVVCFLGFAYATENLWGRLDLPHRLAERGRLVSIFGSAKGLRAGERERVEKMFMRETGRPIALGQYDGTCLDTLLDFHVFQD